MLAVERDVKPLNMNFAKVEKGGGGAINREGAFITKNTVYPLLLLLYLQNVLRGFGKAHVESLNSRSVLPPPPMGQTGVIK